VVFVQPLVSVRGDPVKHPQRAGTGGGRGKIRAKRVWPPRYDSRCLTEAGK